MVVYDQLVTFLCFSVIFMMSCGDGGDENGANTTGNDAHDGDAHDQISQQN